MVKGWDNAEFKRWYKFRGHLIIMAILLATKQVQTFPSTIVLPFTFVYIPIITLMLVVWLLV